MSSAEASPPRILVIEDEAPMRRFLTTLLETHGMRVVVAETAAAAIQATATAPPDVVLLDLGLPDLDGLEVARRLREWSATPIIVLSARGQERDKIDALDLGADDYLTKPFSAGELLARIRVALRHAAQRGAAEGVEPFRAGELEVDRVGRIVRVRGEEVHLTAIEYRLLAYLVEHAGRVLTHRQILKTVWGPGATSRTQYVRVYMQHLRRKLEDDPAQPRYLVTEIGVGYRLLTEEALR